MRFLGDGPDLPLELLEARDRGEVIFFCGAGVSMPAGLPNFRALALQVLRRLGVPATDPAAAIMVRALNEADPLFAPSMDQVFSVLQREYGAGQVEAAVARQLRVPKGADLAHHQAILRLSSRRDGRRRVITTNFDHLFDRADPRQRRFIPPFLPDINNPDALEGVVYLHGRAQPTAPPTTRQGLVLTSADFGRAYLSEGWATRFMRELLARYTLVLLGYSAEDPPVRYLLEGLNAGGGSPNPIYTFAAGSAGDAEPQWRARGVRPIAYTPADRAHSGLWRSLEAWAQRADDPVAWRNAVLTQAMRGPRDLAAHERGQVAAIAQTASGAETFRRARPPAEWLCVFDARVRYARRGAGMFDRTAPFDPLATYGLDNDPPRPPGTRHEEAPPGINVLAPTAAETQGAPFVGPTGQAWAPLSPRLQDLVLWIASAALEPATLWWAARQTGLHPTFQHVIARDLRRPIPSEHSGLAHGWRLLLDCASDIRDPRREWYGLREYAAREGWTPSNLRDLAEILRPRLVVSRLFQGRPEPPASPEPLRGLVHFEVKFLDVATRDLDVVDTALPQVVEVWRDALRQGVNLLHDAHPISWRTASLHPDEHPGRRTFRDGSSFFIHFAQLFDRLAAGDPSAARREADHWPVEEDFFFNKLRVWAWRRPDLYPAGEAAQGLLALSDHEFWDGGFDRELLWTLRARWSDFDRAQREALETRIAAGPPPWPDEIPESHRRRAASDGAIRLGWLERVGCVLSAATMAALPSLRAADPGWSPQADAHADDSREGRVGWVRTETDPAALLDQPLSQILSVADEAAGLDRELFVRADPFAGLVAARPARALSALAYQGRKGELPLRGWRAFLEARDAPLTARQRALAGARIAALPAAALCDLRFELARWVEGALPQLAIHDLTTVWRLWDAMLAALVSGGPPATASSIGDTSVGGVSLGLSRRTYDHAINGPVGQLVRAALDVLNGRQLPESAGIPIDIRVRLDAALQAPGEGGDHATNILLSNLPWLHFLDPTYSVDVLEPMLAAGADTAEPAWSGLLHYPEPLSPTLFRRIKLGFLDTFRVAATWRWSDVYREFASILVSLRLPLRPRYLSGEQFRTALQIGGPSACAAALSALSHFHSSEETIDWPTVRRVLRYWPKEIRLQTPEVVRIFFNLAIDAGTDFPAAVSTVSPFLQPTENVDLYMLAMPQLEAEGPPLSQRFPRATLALARAVASPTTSRDDLVRVLDAVAEADPAACTDPHWPYLAALAGR